MSRPLHDSFVAVEGVGDAESLSARVDRHAPQPIRAVGDQRLGAERAVTGPGKEGGVIAVTVGYEMQGVAYRFSWRAPQ